MNKMVTPAVTAPRATVASRIGRRNRHGRGRIAASRITAAHASRSQIAPSGPIWPNSGTVSARPAWTQAIEPTAIAVPARAADGLALRVTVPVDTRRIVRVHVIFVDIPFTNNE
jgi:hypothetical protein